MIMMYLHRGDDDDDDDDDNHDLALVSVQAFHFLFANQIKSVLKAKQ